MSKYSLVHLTYAVSSAKIYEKGTYFNLKDCILKQIIIGYKHENGCALSIFVNAREFRFQFLNLLHEALQ